MRRTGNITEQRHTSSRDRAIQAMLAGVKRRGAALGAALIFGLLGAAPALAGVGGAVGPTWPGSVQVGQSFAGYIDIWNVSNGVNASEYINVSAINFTPSCAAGTSAACTSPDPGVFSFASPLGAPGTACSGVLFYAMPPNPATGEISFVPSRPVRLGPTDGSGGAQSPPHCRIVLGASILKMPRDSNLSTDAVNTMQYARAVLVGEVSGSAGGGVGQGTVTVVGPSLSLTAAGSNAQVALNWSSTPSSPSNTYKLVFATGSAPASCAAGTVLLNGATATTFAHTGRQNGTTYYYRVCATDSVTGATATATASATPQAGNAPPVANAGPNMSTQTLTSMTFNGSGSTDPDGTITSFAWNFGDGTTGTGVTATHAYASAGTYTATLTVTDNNGASASNTAVITIANRPPVANAGPDQSAQATTPVSFSGSASSDPDGTIASFSWNFGDGTTGTGVTASHAYASAGTYTATLTVLDNNGATASDTAVITVAAAAASSGSFKSAARYGGTSSGASTVGYGTAVDASGNVIVVGAFWGTISLGGASLTSAGGSDVFVAKYSPTGAHLWSKRFGNIFDDAAAGVAVGSDGSVVVAGYFASSVNFGGSTLTAPGTAKSDAFVVKLSAAGDHVWSSKFGGGGDDGAYGVAVDGSGNVVLTGCFTGAAAFGSVVLTAVSSSTDAFLAKLAPDGALSWAKSFGGSGIDCGNGVGVDGAGNITLVGSFMGPANFGGGTGSLSGFGIADVVLARYSPTGAHLWSKQIGGGGDDAGYAVAVDASGNAAVTGYVQGLVDFGGGSTSSLGSLDTFVAKYSPSGAHVWSRRIGSTNAEQGFGVAMDVAGNVFLAGTFQGSVDFGTGVLESEGLWDIVAAKYSPSGVALWSKSFGDTGDDYAYAVATDSSGNSVFTGMFHGTIDFGGGNLTSAGWIDMYVVKFGP